MSKIKVCIVGGAGYTAGELLRILLFHPEVEVSCIQSNSNPGQPVSSIHPDLFFSKDLAFSENINDEADVYFLCKGHGESFKILNEDLILSDKYIIDLSQDFRLADDHPEIQKKYGQFIYGLPELKRNKIRKAKNIANPGCFATCIQLGLLPLAVNDLIKNDVHVSAITGSTGAGQTLSSTSHFSWRNNNVSVYKPFQHQHLSEIYQGIKSLQNKLTNHIHFIPYRGNFTRGIIATIYMDADITGNDAIEIYKEYYRKEPFVRISKDNVYLKQVINTNFGLLYVKKIGTQLMIISIIDNLLKGASGQSVQNMNLMFGINEGAGLNIKGSAF